MFVRWLIFFLALIGSPALSLPAVSQETVDRPDQGFDRITHVFVITLENEGYDIRFDPSSETPYLSKTLTAQGALPAQHFGTGHNISTIISP